MADLSSPPACKAASTMSVQKVGSVSAVPVWLLRSATELSSAMGSHHPVLLGDQAALSFLSQAFVI